MPRSNQVHLDVIVDYILFDSFEDFGFNFKPWNWIAFLICNRTSKLIETFDSAAVNLRMTDNTMAKKKKKTKGQTMVHKASNRKLK